MKLSELLVELKNGGKFPQPTIKELNKIAYFNTLIEWCLTEEDGFKMVNYRLKNVYELIFALESFYAIELDAILDEEGNVSLELMLNVIDELNELIIDANNVILRRDGIREVLCNVDIYLAKYCKNANSMQAVVKDGIEKLIAKIPDIDSKQIDKWMKQLPKALDKLSPENKEIIKKVIDNAK